MEKPIVGITQGDTNGVGLEIIIKALAPEGITDILTPVIFANKKLTAQTIAAIEGETIRFQPVASAAEAKQGKINLVNIGDKDIEPQYGVASPQSGQEALLSLQAACDALEAGDIDLLVTAPICKEAIQSEDFKFPGHTEFLQARFADNADDDADNDKAMMILFNDDMRIALLTTHLPLTKVSDAVRADKIVDAAKRLDKILRRDFACDRPKIAILALNPHCGDGGLLGEEEKLEIIPAVKTLREEKVLAFGPFAADGFFGNEDWKNFDGVLAMYHDQGLAPFKALAKSSGVNFTAGLEYVRTSPDHGTAFDIAGKMIADPTSMREAIYKGIDIWRRRRIYDAAAENPLPLSAQKTSNRPQ